MLQEISLDPEFNPEREASGQNQRTGWDADGAVPGHNGVKGGRRSWSGCVPPQWPSEFRRVRDGRNPD